METRIRKHESSENLIKRFCRKVKKSKIIEEYIENQYYKKPCLMALSLYGNELRPGRSIIIYLLNEKMDKVHSIEKIHLRDNLKLRHFVTNSKNELYEDQDGSIYVSADKIGIYKLSFVYFRN